MISLTRPRFAFSAFRPFKPFIMVVAVLSILHAGSAWAQDQATIDKLVQLNKKAMDDYDTADFDPAKKALLEAEKLGKRAGLESHPVMARTYIHLGALFLTGFKDKKKAQHYFGKALDIQPDIKLDKNLTASSVRDAFAAAQSKKGAPAASAGGVDEELFPPAEGKNASKKGGRSAPEPVAAAEPEAQAEPEAPSGPRRKRPLRRDTEEAGEPDLPTTITALDCPYPDDTPPGKKVTLRCVAAANLGVASVVLFFRGFQMSNYEEIAMTKSPKGWWQAVVPKKRVDGTSLQFYFEGMDASGKPVVSNGRSESPNVMLIVEGDNKAGVGVNTGEDENPLEEGNRSSPKLLLGKYDKSRIGVDARYGNRRFWVGLGLGTGGTYAIDGVPESRVCGLDGDMRPVPCTPGRPDVIISGGGWAGLGHLAPEIGVHINPDWAISVESRHQYIYQTKRVAGYTASGAHAVLLKVIRYTKQQRFRLFYAVAGGGGEGVRMNILSDPMNSQLNDTVLIGGVLLGGTVGVNYEISKRISWVAEVNALFGFPKKGIVGDFNTALQFNFGDTSGAAEAAAAKKAGSVSGSIDDEEPQ